MIANIRTKQVLYVGKVFADQNKKGQTHLFLLIEHTQTPTLPLRRRKPSTSWKWNEGDTASATNLCFYAIRFQEKLIKLADKFLSNYSNLRKRQLLNNGYCPTKNSQLRAYNFFKSKLEQVCQNTQKKNCIKMSITI